MKSHYLVAPLVAPLLAAMLLVACAAPEFKQPTIETPTAFKESSQPLTAADGTRWQPARAAEAQPRGEWWLAFNDPVLTQLIDDATKAQCQPRRGIGACQAGARHCGALPKLTACRKSVSRSARSASVLHR